MTGVQTCALPILILLDPNNEQEEYNGIKEETESGGCVYPGLKTMVEQ